LSSGRSSFSSSPASRLDLDRKVDNREDLEGRTPLAADNEHWENAMLSDVLKEAIVGRPRTQSMHDSLGPSSTPARRANSS